MTPLALLQAECESSDDWLQLQNLLSQLDRITLDPALKKLFEQVDQSDYSLSDWIKALLIFDQWLDDKKIQGRPVASMLSYIHCCTLTLSDNLAPPDLARLTNEMLKLYGFDAASESTT